MGLRPASSVLGVGLHASGERLLTLLATGAPVGLSSLERLLSGAKLLRG